MRGLLTAFFAVAISLGVSSALGLGACVGTDSSPPAGVDAGGDAAQDTNVPPSPTDSGGEAGDGGDGADAGPWTPARLDQADQLALWLEASSPTSFVISNGMVGTWHDLSKHKNDATNTNAGPTVAAKVVNGHDAVHFAEFGVALRIADAPSLALGKSQFFLAAVTKASPAAGAYAYLFAKPTVVPSGGGEMYSTGLEVFVKRGVVDGGSGLFPAAIVDAQSGNEVDWNDAVFDDGQFHLVALRRVNADTFTLLVDAHPGRTGTTGTFDVSEPGKAALIGSIAYGNIAATVDFSIAELVIVHGASGVVDDNDVANLLAYLRAKYAL